MRYLFIIIVFLSGLSAFGQDLDSKKQTIDLLVESIDQHKNYGVLGFRTRSVPQMSYVCRVSYDRPIRITRDYMIKEDSVQQVFYSADSKLVYAEEIITSFITNGDSTITKTWAGKFYFDNDVLIDQITLGHGKSEEDDWNPQKEILSDYKTAIKEFSNRYKKKN